MIAELCGIDLGKTVFHLVSLNKEGHIVIKKRFSRKNYFIHGHPTNPAFAATEFLILVSAETPPPDLLDLLSRPVNHIDREHFLSWYQTDPRTATNVLGRIHLPRRTDNEQEEAASDWRSSGPFNVLRQSYSRNPQWIGCGH